ncbi:hypothetical protein ABZS79_09810 [Streptomyces griseoloalbus]|uniref:hypothetical protein n=1 Tax=Streptomyces griseoloalbus TaxID=67303 RepID=UPI00339ECE25
MNITGSPAFGVTTSQQRGLDISDDVRSRITGCTDPDLLRRWLTRAVTVPKAEEIFEGE